MTYEQLKAEHPALFAQIATEAKASAEAEAKELLALAAADSDKARVEGAQAENARVLGIIGHAEAKGREALALKLASMPTMTIDGAAEIMAATPKTAPAVGTEFEAAMAKLNPAVESDAPAADGEEAQAAAVVARIAALANGPQKRL